MELQVIDWAFIIGFFIIALGIGVMVSKSAGQSETDFFLGGRSMPWWLLGFSMVATTFSTDTPNLVTDLVRQNGVAANWVWWAFLLTGMLTVFIFARLWRRSAVTTDVEFYEIRYSGKTAAFLRGFRALYLGVFFNIMIMGGVSLAAIKIGGVTLGLEPWQSLGLAILVTMVFSTMGGFKGVLLTDFLLFIMAMVGAFAAAYFALGHEAVGGLSGLIDQFQADPELASKLDIFPKPTVMEDGSKDYSLLVSLFIIPLAVQWWSVYYPGAEPGGGGYLAQRMLAAKTEKHALGATLFFNVAHYAIRPWPWILVALASMLVYPNISDLQAAFPHIPADKLGHDLAYSAMLETVPPGWLGLIMASLIAAYMSTISTHLNWGSSYIVNDFYIRFIKPSASQREMVWVGRVSTVILTVVTVIFALFLQNAQQLFNILLQVGAGTGLLLIMRWFWWRINPISELTAMVVSFLVAVGFVVLERLNIELAGHWQLLLGVTITTTSWIVATLVTQPSDHKTLVSFIEKINPGGAGWNAVKAKAEAEGQPIQTSVRMDSLPKGILRMVLGCLGVYGFLFGTGYFIYGETTIALVSIVVAAVSTVILVQSLLKDEALDAAPGQQA